LEASVQTSEASHDDLGPLVAACDEAASSVGTDDVLDVDADAVRLSDGSDRDDDSAYEAPSGDPSCALPAVAVLVGCGRMVAVFEESLAVAPDEGGGGCGKAFSTFTNDSRTSDAKAPTSETRHDPLEGENGGGGSVWPAPGFLRAAFSAISCWCSFFADSCFPSSPAHVWRRLRRRSNGGVRVWKSSWRALQMKVNPRDIFTLTILFVALTVITKGSAGAGAALRRSAHTAGPHEDFDMSGVPMVAAKFLLDDRTLLCDTECIEDLFFSPAMRVDEDSGDIILSECCTDRNTDLRDGAEFDSGGDGMIEIDEISFHVLVEEMLESLRLDGGEQFEDMLAPLSIDGGDEAAD